MSIKTGPHEMMFAPWVKVLIQAEKPFAVWALNAEGSPTKLVGVSDAQCRVGFCTSDFSFMAMVNVDEGVHWVCEEKTIPAPTEYPDPTPVEAPADMELESPLWQKMKTFIAGAIANQYGKDSPAYESLDEAMDFGDDDEDELFSGFEVRELEPVEPVEPEKPRGEVESPPAPEPLAEPEIEPPTGG